MQSGETVTTAGGQKTVELIDMVTDGNGFDHRPQSIDEAGRTAFLLTFDDGLKAVFSAQLVPAP